MDTIYAVTGDGYHGYPYAVFESEEAAEAHAATLGGETEVVELPLYPRGVQPMKTTWWRAGSQPGRPGRVQAFQQTHWDWYESAPLSPEMDGVLQGGDNSRTHPYFFCESYDKATAERVVREAYDNFKGPLGPDPKPASGIMTVKQMSDVIRDAWAAAPRL